MAENRPESPARNFVTHLRLPFQLLLAPFMLWGAVLAHARLSWHFAAAFVVLTVCFYGATTAFNSHYDRDEGPIGGLEEPPPPGPWLLPGSLILQGIGLILAWLIAPAFAASCAAFAVLGILYSHPVPRFKGHPWLSWLTVMLGQGALGAVAGATAAIARIPWTWEAAFGLLAAAFIVGGLYPISQVYQMEEDKARGDRTVALVLGREGVRVQAMLLFGLGLLAMIAARFEARRAWDAIILVPAYLPLMLGAWWVTRNLPPKVAFRRVMRFQVAAGAAFTLYTLFRLISP